MIRPYRFAVTLADMVDLENGEAPNADELQGPPSWFAKAIAAHQADEQRTPANAGWDQLWVANYQRLISLWSRL